MYVPLERCTPQRERALRREWKAAFKERGIPYPTLHAIGFVEVTAIRVPAWAWGKAIPGLNKTDTGIWLRRILARELMWEDERAGGTPKVTWSVWRPCKLCKRNLIGLEAEARYLNDIKIFGWCIPCGPDCSEVEEARKSARRKRNRGTV